MIVGWRVAPHMRTRWSSTPSRWPAGHAAPRWRAAVSLRRRVAVHVLRYGERLAEIGAVPSIGTVGDSYDNALAETVNGYYKAELIRGPARPSHGRPSRTSSSPRSAGSTGTTPAAARLPRRPTTDRVRADVLRCPSGRPRPGRNPIARASTQTQGDSTIDGDTYVQRWVVVMVSSPGPRAGSELAIYRPAHSSPRLSRRASSAARCSARARV